MVRKEVPIFTKIDLIPWEGEEFYVYIIPEDVRGHFSYGVWLFRKDFGIAMSAYGAPKEHFEIVTLEHIKALDEDGYFDPMKEELYEMP